jgi:RNA polymerase sigma factor (sigma-70 family)
MQKVTGSNSQTEQTDERLLHDYVAGHDAGAFAAIVRRHGTMVWAVCRRILRREQDAEDAFQATFVVLMRRAPSLSRPKLLGNWLYGVAYRTAIKIRSCEARLRRREAPMVDLPAPDSNSAAVWCDLKLLLDDELQRLPPRYRAPMVLFYLEGRSVEEVALSLGCPMGTVLSRLSRARERLRVRLTRRGLALSAGVLATSLAQAASADGALTALSPESSALAGKLLAASHGSEESFSWQARMVAQQVLKDLARIRLQIAGGLILAGLLVTGVGIVAYRAFLLPGTAGEHLNSVPDAGKSAGAVPLERPDSRADIDQLQGTWKVVAAQSDGQTLAEEQFPITQWKVQGSALRLETRMGSQDITIRLDPSQNPKHIDMVPRRYDQITYRAIYALDGDTLKICRTETTGLDRPTELASKPGSRVLFLTAKRTSP